MARPVTEMATIPLAAGAEVENLDSAAGKVLSDTFETLRQQEGFQRVKYGRQVENPSILQVFIDWDSIDFHKKFEAQPYYGPFCKHLLSIIDGDMDICHAHFSPHPPSAAVGGLSAVTELVSHYFAADMSESDQTSFSDDVKKFAKVLESKAEGFKGFAGGWVVEDITYKEVEGKTKMWQSCIGWESIDAHMRFRETQAFKDNVDLLRPESRKASTIHHRNYCPPIDSALFYAITSDYDLRDPVSLEEARTTLNALKESTAIDDGSSFDPSGSSRPYDVDESASSQESVERAQSWHGDLASEDTDRTSVSHLLDSLNIHDGTGDAGDHESHSLGSTRNDQKLDPLTFDQKSTLLCEMFATTKTFDIEYVLKKVGSDFGKAVEELLNYAFLASEDIDVEEKTIKKGVDAFLDPNARGRRPKGKRKKQARRTSSTPAPSDDPSTESSATLSRWDVAKEDVDFIAQRTNVPASTIRSIYHASGASLPLAIAALCTSPVIDSTPRITLTDPDTLNAHAAELALDFPALSYSVAKALTQLTHPSTAAAHELARAMSVSSNLRTDSIVPTYVPRPPSPPRNTVRSTPRKLVMPFDTATGQASASAAARSHALTQASAAYRRSKSKPLMGGAASYYSSVGREAAASLQRYESAAADARVTSQSRAGEIDLHGVSVKDAVRIAQEKVELWWEAEGQEWARAGKVMGGKGLSIVTGVGRHSEGGRGKLGPAVGAMLVREGWKIEIGNGILNVVGRVRG
ncbi:MAG: hypothetical protein Q9222_002698 [Ikaeria aurantiellina]